MSADELKKIIDGMNTLSMSISEEISAHKDMKPYADKTFGTLRRQIPGLNSGPLPDSFIESVFTECFSRTVSRVSPVKAAFLGPEGTFSNLATNDFFGHSVDYVPCKTIPDVFRSVEKNESDYGVVPVENSTEGSVTFTLDELIETDLFIIAERYIRISFSLLSKSENTGLIKRVYTHPQPAGQAKNWLRANLPDAEIVIVESTVKAAEMASNEIDSGAIASEISAERLGLRVVASSIEDMRQNFTRFFILGREPEPRSGSDKTSIVCTVKDKPGALIDMLKPISDAGINMAKIESRPDKKQVWQYNFFIDILGHKDDEHVKRALDEIRREALFLKIIGSYPAGK